VCLLILAFHKGLHDLKYSKLQEGYIMQNHDPAHNARIADLCRFYALKEADYI